MGSWRALKAPSIKAEVSTAGHLKLPFLEGRLIRDLHAAQMPHARYATMIASRLPLLEGLSLTAGTIYNARLRLATDEIVDPIRGGGSLSAAMRRSDRVPATADLYGRLGRERGTA